MEHHKLVRDRIPEIIHSRGQTCSVTTMTEEEYRQALREKLVEEAREAAQAGTVQDLVTELADISEVLDALMAIYCIPAEVVQAEQESRRKERGAFAQRLRLVWTKQIS